MKYIAVANANGAWGCEIGQEVDEAHQKWVKVNNAGEGFSVGPDGVDVDINGLAGELAGELVRSSASSDQVAAYLVP